MSNEQYYGIDYLNNSYEITSHCGDDFLATRKYYFKKYPMTKGVDPAVVDLIADANLGREVRRSLPHVGASDAWSLASAGIWGPIMRTAWEQLREDGDK